MESPAFEPVMTLTPPLPRPPLRDVAVDGFRRVLAASIFFLCLFLFVRTFALEPFGVPTGSMAGTFLGNHRELECPRCGFPVVIGEPGNDRPTLKDACCPNCGQKHLNLVNARELPGDRLLVDKNIFNLRSPRRWEVCVFRCPVDDSKPYVKRVIGLPGEAIQLRGGDVYANGILQRKSLAQCRECWILAFDQAHAPPDGWGQRWLVESLTDAPRAAAAPAGPEILQGGAIVLDATTKATPALGLTYRHWNLDTQQEETLTDWLAYNGTAWHRQAQNVHDFAVRFDLDVDKGNGSFACRLSDGLDSAFVEFPIGNGAPAGTKLGQDGPEPPLQSPLRLAAGKSYRIEFSFIDRRVIVAVDGSPINPALDLPAVNLIARTGVSRPVQFGVRGMAVSVKNFQLFRDVHLRADGANASQTPWQLAADEYFMAGDNSNNSNDSREWKLPGVPERDFLGKPFLIHQPLKLGRVSVGGQDRTYQAIDWSRLRWVR